MHIPDGFVSGPINVLGYAVAVSACAGAFLVSRRNLGERQVPLVGMTAAFVFAAQMLNFPVVGGTSGHFLGAVFAALLLGPWTACLVMGLVLVVQCLFFADGGITALGSNIVNMGVVGVAVGYGMTRLVCFVLPRGRSSGLAAVAIASWCSVMCAATACSFELGMSGKPLHIVLPAMLGIHALIGIGEALITVAMASMILAARPDLLPILGAASATVPAPQPEVMP